jgi:L-iditol 2-dehydrogenase
LLKEKGSFVALSDIHDKRLKIGKNCGADVTITPKSIKKIFLHSATSPSERISLKRVSQVFGDFLGFDHVFECTGMPEVWESSITYVRRGGTVVLFGGCKSGTTVTYDTGRIHYDEITLKGVFHFTPSDVKKAYNLLLKRKLGVSRLISGSYPLTKIQKAFNKLAKGEGIKYAIIP